MGDLESLRRRYPGAEAFRFGDGPDLSAALLGLVMAGTKTATCGALRDFEKELMPVVGRRDVACRWDWTPAVMIETAEVTLRRFCDVDAAFALDEGENPDLAGWQRDHRAYFERNGGWSPEMVLVCERFRVVEVLDG